MSARAVNACPTWCAGLDEPVTHGHPDDLGTRHTSAPVDAWATRGSGGAPIVVAVEGFTHADARLSGGDWALPTLTGSDSLGGEFEATFTPLDARRLAAALTLAADLADQG